MSGGGRCRISKYAWLSLLSVILVLIAFSSAKIISNYNSVSTPIPNSDATIKPSPTQNATPPLIPPTPTLIPPTPTLIPPIRTNALPTLNSFSNSIFHEIQR